jgi:hypothetical protein
MLVRLESGLLLVMRFSKAADIRFRVQTRFVEVSGFTESRM